MERVVSCTSATSGANYNGSNPGNGIKVNAYNTYIHTYIHTYIQTYIHTDRQTEPKYDIEEE